VPRPNDPLKPEYYVYVFSAAGIPFYVGIGRSERASDRIRYVRSQMEREKKGLSGKWALHTRVIAEFLNRGIDVDLRYLRRNVARGVALEYEKKEIQKLRAKGLVLANRQLNPGGPKEAEEVVKSVLSAAKQTESTPNNRFQATSSLPRRRA
jgi:hypothetical protein